MVSEIRKGFLIGLGFMIPLLVVEFTIKYTFYAMTNGVFDAYEETLSESGAMNEVGDAALSDSEEYSVKEVYEDFNKSYAEQIFLSPFSENYQGGQLLITGQFTNNSEEDIHSLEIEAELFNAEGIFVYECAKSFYEKQAPGVTENYMIKCGCSKDGVPEYTTAKVRVVKASSY